MGACCCRGGKGKFSDDDTDILLGQRSDVELHSVHTLLPNATNGENRSGNKKHKNSDCDEDLEQLVDEHSKLDMTDEILETEGGPPLSPEIFYSPAKAVSFGLVSEREYSRCMDFHPCISTGVPLGLDWEFCENEEISLDAFEARRLGERVQRQEYASQGRLDARVRLALAQHAGHGRHEIDSMNKKVEIAKVERYRDFLEAQADLRQQRQKQVAAKKHALNEQARGAMALGTAIGKSIVAAWLLVTQGDKQHEPLLHSPVEIPSS
mmetsp:Transcript_32189/g.58884  ORF Transcript_32189/g.58884 Transcript_32189/m.58884 type:complete len:266 (-) Transcript_32189:71-868(-)